MSFLWAAGLGFLGVLPLVAALYFLRLRRTVKVVSSTWLWKRALDEYRVNRPFQRFTNHVLLWLQLAAAALLAFAVARPFVEARRPDTGIHLFLVDHSASMSTVEEGGKTRLEAAKEFVRTMAGTKPESDRMMVIAFSDRVHVACPMTTDRAAILRSLETIVPTLRPTRLQEAWQAAVSVARRFDASDLYIVSDGGFRVLEPLTEAHASVHYVPVGRTADNLGIVHLETRVSEESRKHIEIFARVVNRRPRDAQATVELRLNDRLVDAQQIAVKGDSERGVVFERPLSEEGMIEVRLAGTDAFAADDRAWIPLRSLEPLRVVLVGEENVFLKQAFAMESRVELVVVAPADYVRLRPQLAEADLVVFDGVDPGPLERGSYLVFGAVPAGWTAAGESSAPTLRRWDGEHPLTRYINFSTLHIAKGVRFETPAWATTLVTGDQGPVLAAGERGGVRVAVAGFRVLETDWPLRVSFPLFIANALRWAKDTDLSSLGSAVLPGQTLVIRAPREAQEGTLTTPDGAATRLSNVESDRIAFAATERTGVYRVRWDRAKSDVLYAVSLLDPAESDIRPAADLAMGDATVQGHAGSSFVKRELTHWLVILAISVLLVEWAVYLMHR